MNLMKLYTLLKGDLFFNINHLKHHLDRGLQDEFVEDICTIAWSIIIRYLMKRYFKGPEPEFLNRSTKIENTTQTKPG
jgi:hypothetical protein